MQVQLLELDKYKELTLDYDKDKTIYRSSIDYEEKKVNVLATQNDRLIEQVRKSESMSTWEKAAYFGVGVLATVAAGIAFSEAAKQVSK